VFYIVIFFLFGGLSRHFPASQAFQFLTQGLHHLVFQSIQYSVRYF